MFEVEQKYHVDEPTVLTERLRELGAIELHEQRHRDTYFNHPARDFVDTQEAFRIRQCDHDVMLTYKGPKLPGKIKARRELEFLIGNGDSTGGNMQELLNLLSFKLVAVVEKTRQSFQFQGDYSDMNVVVDHVARLGWFAEIELIVDDESEVANARDRIAAFGIQVGLHRFESRSYLRMLLENQ